MLPQRCHLNRCPARRPAEAGTAPYASKSSRSSGNLDASDVIDDLDVAADVATGGLAAQTAWRRRPTAGPRAHSERMSATTLVRRPTRVLRAPWLSRSLLQRKQASPAGARRRSADIWPTGPRGV